MRRVPIRLKLAAALSIPLLALGVVTVLRVAQTASDADEVRQQTDLAEAAVGPAGVISMLQNERTWPAVDLIGMGDSVTVKVRGYDETRADTDEALSAFRDEIASMSPEVEAAFKPALDNLADLEALRADIDENVATVDPRTPENNITFSHEVFDRYTQMIAPFFDATTRISLAIDDPELRQGTEMADAAARQIEVMSLLLNGIIGDYTLSEGKIDTNEEITRASINLQSFKNHAATMLGGTGPYAEIAEQHFPGPLTDRVIEQAEQAITTNEMDLDTMLAAVNVPEEESYSVYQDAVADQIDSRSDSLNSSARSRTWWIAGLTLSVLVVAIFLVWVVSRSITRPLRSLTRQARDMAERRLPDAVLDILETPLGEDVTMPSIEPVRLTTRDEVADVAVALNTVQDTALRLAVEQAVLRRNIADSFVNLGRRNQNLLGRQLDFITELESNETDPDTLANLFRLDHLATRMRRNAESLLVLAGIEPPRKWAAPVRITDVIRAALGEVEDYQRVAVRNVEAATIIGSAAADLAHLIAELVENALVFSPPDQNVDIRGRNRPDGYTLAIIDSGLGMPPADITAANRRLAGAESFTIAPSKYLGHYVAGNLAARHDIRVHLDNSPGNGITATIDLPPTILTTDTAPAQGSEPHAARDVWPPMAANGEPAGVLAPPGPGALPARRPPVEPQAAPHRGQATPAPGGHTQPMAFPRADFAPPPAAPAYGAPARDPWPDPAPGPSGAPPWYDAPPPAAPAPGADQPGLPRRQADIDAEAEARRTASGLVKRTPRVVDTGEVTAVGRGPNDDLLASLSRYTNGRDLTGPQPAIGSPPPPPQARSGPQAAPDLPSRATPPPAPPRSADAPSPSPRRGGGLSGLAAGLSDLSTFRGPTTPPSQGNGPTAPADGPAATSGGLPRRVQGAQLPNANPLAVRRSSSGGQPAPGGPAPGGPTPGGPTPGGPTPGGPTSGGPASATRPAPAGPSGPAGPSAHERSTPQPSQSADAVYSFLTNFTAGVQRGLDESRPGNPPRHGG